MKKTYISPLVEVDNIVLETYMQTVSDPDNMNIPVDNTPTDPSDAETNDRYSWDENGSIW